MSTRWTYQITGYAAILRPQIEAVLQDLVLGTLDPAECAADTRPCHGRFFRGLTPPKQPYWAGSYRGSSHPGLIDCGVTFNGKTGVAPARVLGIMTTFGKKIRRGVAKLDELHASSADPVEKLAKTAHIIAKFFAPFLLFHPYADGNGHAGRFLVLALFMRHGYRPNGWTVDPRPPGDLYMDLILAAERGDVDPLATHLISCCSGSP